MWILTLSPLVAYALAGYDVGRFYDLWENGWIGLLTATGMGLGVKFTKDTIIRKAELNANVAAGVPQPTQQIYSKDGLD